MTIALTNRERDIVRVVLEGASNRVIAGRLGLREQTVKNHLSSIFSKLGVSSRLELALFVLEHRIVERRPGPPSARPGST